MTRSAIELRTVWATLLLLIVMLGCSVQNVRQLDRYKTLAASGDDAAIIAEAVNCTAGDSGCDQLHLIRGMSCYREGKREIAPSASFDCAITELEEGLTQAQTQGQTPEAAQPYEEALLESLRERGDLTTSWAESTPYTTQLTQRADRFRVTYPSAQAGYYYAATARLLDANRLLVTQQTQADPCEMLLQSQGLLEQGALLSGNLSPNIELTLQETQDMLRQECAT